MGFHKEHAGWGLTGGHSVCSVTVRDSGHCEALPERTGSATRSDVSSHHSRSFDGVVRVLRISGEHTTPIVIDEIGYVHLVGVRLRADGAWPFLGIPLRDFTDQVVQLDATRFVKRGMTIRD